MNKNTEIESAKKHYIKNLPINPHGVFMMLAEDERKDIRWYSNVPVSCLHHSPDGFSWGYGGSGPSDLALNILEYAVQELGLAQSSRVDCYIGTCSDEAWLLHHSFKRDFLAGVPEEGGVIAWPELELWLRAALEPDISAVPAPSELRLTLAYPAYLFDSLSHIYGNMDKELSAAAFFSAIGDWVAENEPYSSTEHYIFKPIAVQIEATPVNLIVNDSASTGEKTDLSIRTQQYIQSLLQKPSVWMIEQPQ